MRKRFVRWADRAGVRSVVADKRDRLVDLLEGRSRNARRNSIDDRNLKLLIRFCLRPDSNWLEVGANRGMFLHDVQRVAPDGHHVVYEPVPNQFERLIRLFPGMDIRQRALSNQNGKSRFTRVLDAGSQGLSRLEKEGDPLPRGGLHTETLLITTERLDDARPDGWLPNFVKIDVEGAELDVLHGAINTLRAARPVIAFEHGRSHRSEEIFDLLSHDVGLRIFDMNGRGPLTLADFMDPTRERWNWVAHR